MSWLVWRQHRGELLFTSSAVLLIAAFLAVIRVLLARSYGDLGIDSCDSASTDFCRNALQTLSNSYSWLNLVVFALLLLPAFLGMFIGAPLVAREFEAGTFRLAWVQSVTRSRWFLAKIVAIAGASALAAAAVTAAVTWALDPLIRADALLNLNFLIPMTAPLFDVTGTALVATTLLAIAAGTLFGALAKRTVLAMVVTLIVFAGVRIPMNAYVRPNVLPPVTASAPIGATGNMPADLPAGSWVMRSGFVDRQGNTYELLGEVAAPCRTTGDDPAAFARCMDGLGIRSYVTYEPPDRFWQFQGIESGAYVTLAGLLVLAAWWHVRYRIA